MSKVCGICNIEKGVELYGKNKAKKDGLDHKCKDCARIKAKRHYDANKETIKLKTKKYVIDNKNKVAVASKSYVEKNKDKVAERQRQWYLQNKAKVDARNKMYYVENKERMNELSRQYHANNKERLNAISRKYAEDNVDKIREYKKKWNDENRDKIQQHKMERYYTDANYRLKHNLSTRMRGALAGANKSASTVELIGCDFDFLRDYIEADFDDKMTWLNYGSYWVIDHIKPCASFDLTNPEQQKICFHWSNLRPLEMIENIRKGDKIIDL